MNDGHTTVSALLESHRASLSKLNERLARLLDVYLDGSVSQEEYVSRKQHFLAERSKLKTQIKDLERGQVSPFEPMLDFFISAKQAGTIASSEGDLTVLRDFHRRIGSNLRLSSPEHSRRGHPREFSRDGKILDSILIRLRDASARQVGRPERTNSSVAEAMEDKSEFLFGGFSESAPALCSSQGARKVSQDKEDPPARRSRTGGGGSPHSVVTPCVATKSTSRFSGQSTKRPVPVLLVQYPMPWKIFADLREISNWRRGRDSNPR